MWDFKSNGSAIRVTIITPIYKTKIVTKVIDGEKIKKETSILVKEIRTTKWLKKEGITSVDNYLTSKNTIASTRSLIFDKFTNKFYAVGHSQSDIISNIEPKQPNKIGY